MGEFHAPVALFCRKIHLISFGYKVGWDLELVATRKFELGKNRFYVTVINYLIT